MPWAKWSMSGPSLAAVDPEGPLAREDLLRGHREAPGLQNVSRPIDMCYETSQSRPMMLVEPSNNTQVPWHRGRPFHRRPGSKCRRRIPWESPLPVTSAPVMIRLGSLFPS